MRDENLQELSEEIPAKRKSKKESAKIKMGKKVCFVCMGYNILALYVQQWHLQSF